MRSLALFRLYFQPIEIFLLIRPIYMRHQMITGRGSRSGDIAKEKERARFPGGKNATAAAATGGERVITTRGIKWRLGSNLCLIKLSWPPLNTPADVRPSE